MKKTIKLPHSYSSSSFRGSDHSPDFVIPVTRHLGMPRTMHLISPCEAFYMRRADVEEVPRDQSAAPRTSSAVHHGVLRQVCTRLRPSFLVFRASASFTADAE